MDRISHLPNNVLELILDKVSVVDQVRTSALSRNWKFKWTRVSSLELDEEFYDCLDPEGDINVLECVNTINNLLLQHSGRLHSFALRIYDADQTVNLPLFDNPIRFVSRIPGLERLTIKCDRSLPDPYTLPYSVFWSVSLTHLTLTYCLLRPPSSFGGLPNLVSLCLEHCKDTVDVINGFLSTCPQLRELKMRGFRCKNQTFHISAPKLRYLSLNGGLGNIYLEKAEDLQKMNLYLSELPDGVAVGTTGRTFQVFPDPCSQLCEITVTNYVCKLLVSFGGLQTLRVFRRLKKLTFCNVDLDNHDVLRCVLSILTHSPNLETLTMTLDTKMDLEVDISEYVSMVEEYVVLGINLGHLKEIFVERFRGRSLEMNMIELLLDISPVLEQMHIDVNRIPRPCLEMEKLMFQKMLRFSRASGKAKINID